MSAGTGARDEDPASAEGRSISGFLLIPRRENLWLIRVPLGRDPVTGTRKYINRTVRGNKKQVEKALNALLHSRDTGLVVEPTRDTVAQFLDTWIETAAKPRVRPNTLKEYKALIERYIKPALGMKRLDGLRPLDIQQLYTRMQEKRLSPRTVRFTHQVLNSALKQAVKWRQLALNPAGAVDLPRQSHKEMCALSPEEALRFQEAAAGTPHALLFTFALATGMRPSEYLGLKWKDVDLKAQTVTVQRVVVRHGGAWQFAEPKTPRSRGTMPLPGTVAARLREHYLASPFKAPDDLVFPGNEGQPLDEHNLARRHFKPLVKAAKLPERLRLYDLRHTCATLLLVRGVNPKIVSERLGHASITLTLNTYSHVLPNMEQEAAGHLEAVLFGSSPLS